MALIKCPECYSEISDKSLNCVKCGFPLSKETYQRKSQKSSTEESKEGCFLQTLNCGCVIAFVIIGAIIALILLVGIFG